MPLPLLINFKPSQAAICILRMLHQSINPIEVLSYTSFVNFPVSNWAVNDRFPYLPVSQISSFHEKCLKRQHVTDVLLK